MKTKENKNVRIEERSPEDRIAQLRNRANARGTVDSFEWSTCDAQLLQELIHVATKCGIAVQFGITSKGGAGCVSFWDYKSPSEVFYIRPSEDSSIELRRFIQDLDPSFQ